MIVARPKKCGVYAIYNTVNDKIYIGSSNNITKRLADHRRNLNKGEHDNQHLQRSWIKYGEDAFDFSTIDECPEALLLIREQLHLNIHPDNYNMCPVAGSWLGMHHSEESKAKISSALTGRVVSSETSARMSAANRRRVVGEETRAKMRGNQNGAGRVVSPETRKRMSEAQKGRKASPETKARLSAARKRRVTTDETRARLSVAGKGNTNAAGYVHSSETRQRMSEGQKARQARERENRLAADSLRTTEEGGSQV